MAISVAVCNQKGGVGKSTTAVNVGAYLALAKHRTLLIDLDPQGNSTTSCGVTRSGLKHTTYEVLVDGVPIQEAVKPSSVSGLDVLPSSIDLAGAELTLAQMKNRESILKRLCEAVSAQYDVIMFDCPPSLGLITINALVAADVALIPVQCEYLALEGLSALVQAIGLVRNGHNPILKIGGIVLTMADARANLTKEVSNEVRNFFKELVFQTEIPRNVRLAECPSFGKPICIYDATSSGAIAYDNLAREFSEKFLGASLPEQQTRQHSDAAVGTGAS